MKRALLVIGLLAVVSIGLLWGQSYTNNQGYKVSSDRALSMFTTQPPTRLNSETTSSAATAQTKSVAAVTGQNVYLYAVSVRCSAGTATLTIKDGVAGTTIWTTGAETATTSPASMRLSWTPPLTSTASAGMDITVGTCGASNTSVLDVQASQF